MATTYRSRRIRATVREHITDLIIGATVGVVGAVVLLAITLTLLATVSFGV